MNIEKLESRIAPAAVTVPPTLNPIVVGSNSANHNPVVNTTQISNDLVLTIVALASTADLNHTIPTADVRDLTHFAHLTTVTNFAGTSTTGPSGLDPSLLKNDDQAALSELASPLLRSGLPASSDSVAAILGVDRASTAAFPGAIDLLDDSNSAPLVSALH